MNSKKYYPHQIQSFQNWCHLSHFHPFDCLRLSCCLAVPRCPLFAFVSPISWIDEHNWRWWFDVFYAFRFLCSTSHGRSHQSPPWFWWSPNNSSRRWSIQTMQLLKYLCHDHPASVSMQRYHNHRSSFLQHIIWQPSNLDSIHLFIDQRLHQTSHPHLLRHPALQDHPYDWPFAIPKSISIELPRKCSGPLWNISNLHKVWIYLDVWSIFVQRYRSVDTATHHCSS